MTNELNEENLERLAREAAKDGPIRMKVTRRIITGKEMDEIEAECFDARGIPVCESEDGRVWPKPACRLKAHRGK